jgi:hypothetical protein
MGLWTLAKPFHSERSGQAGGFGVSHCCTWAHLLLDVRAGLVPFTRVISRERLELKQPGDLDLSETLRRAEQASAAEALRVAGEELVNFVKSVPRERD